jgi:hypothetical protein
VSARCAKCHSTPGILDYLGADGSEFGVVDIDHPIGTTVECQACHSEVPLASAIMPSGVELTDLGSEAICMQCHQGRSYGGHVSQALADAGVEDDTISEDLIFLNIHYYAATATKYGTLAQGGYEYAGVSYDGNFAHVEAYDTCTECHDPHTLEVKVEECGTCHPGVAGVNDIKTIRMYGSLVDFDGDGDISEGLYYELEYLQVLLYQAIQMYSYEVTSTPIVYNELTYPFFFLDSNENGVADEEEASYTNNYNAWTPRLLAAAYNYQVSIKDPGAYAHGGKYIIQLLYDSIANLNSVLSRPVSLSRANRDDRGHFAGSEESFRHWDEDGEVAEACSKCHSSGGLPQALTTGLTTSQPLANGFQCTTCHEDISTWSRFPVSSVQFPSGAVIDSGNTDTNLCMTCHQGRTSKIQVDEATAGIPLDTADESLIFINIHYFSAGATRYGTEVMGAYEYDGRVYFGRFEHVSDLSNCTDCHNAHQLDVPFIKCSACHETVNNKDDLKDIRMLDTDWDGDGNTSEGLYGEIDTLRVRLYESIQDYTIRTEKVEPIIYETHSYPFFFIDSDGDGQVDPEEINVGNRYRTWTPRLLRAAFNYQYVAKDPGVFAHNGRYIMQLLYDSIQDLGGSVSGMTRPS